MVDEPEVFPQNKSLFIPVAGMWNVGPDRWRMLLNSELYASGIPLQVFQAAWFSCDKENSFLLYW